MTVIFAVFALVCFRVLHIIIVVSELLTRATAPDSAERKEKIMNTNKSNLSNDIRKAVSLFQEFGQRNYYEHKGRVIIMNDVYDAEGEGLFLSRCARKIARKYGNALAYEWALEQFNKGTYNRLQSRNKVHETARQQKLSDMRLFGANTLIKIREASRA